MNTRERVYTVHKTHLFQKNKTNPALHDMTPLNVILVYFFVKQISAQVKIYQSFLFLEKSIDCKCIENSALCQTYSKIYEVPCLKTQGPALKPCVKPTQICITPLSLHIPLPDPLTHTCLFSENNHVVFQL